MEYIFGVLIFAVAVMAGAILRSKAVRFLDASERREHDPYVHPANIDRERVNREYAAFNYVPKH